MEAASALLPPNSESPHLVCVGVPGEAGVKKAVLKAASSGIRYRVFADSDLGPQLNAVATEPLLASDERRKAFKNYRTLRMNGKNS
jgi:hypothetical protein